MRTSTVAKWLDLVQGEDNGAALSLLTNLSKLLAMALENKQPPDEMNGEEFVVASGNDPRIVEIKAFKGRQHQVKNSGNKTFETILQMFWLTIVPDVVEGNETRRKAKKKTDSGGKKEHLPDVKISKGDIQAFVELGVHNFFVFYAYKEESKMYHKIHYQEIERDTKVDEHVLFPTLKRGLTTHLSPKAIGTGRAQLPDFTIAEILGEKSLESRSRNDSSSSNEMSDLSFSSEPGKRARANEAGSPRRTGPMPFGDIYDKSGYDVEEGGGEVRFKWKNKDPVLGRDVANAFYYNGYVSDFRVQRVLVVDEETRQVLLCTPMNYAAYHILKHRNESVSVNDAYEMQLDKISSQELEDAFKYMMKRRCGKQPSGEQPGAWLFFQKEMGCLKLRTRSDDDEAFDEVEISRFGENGGWGEFLVDLLQPKMDWLAIVKGSISSSEPLVVRPQNYRLAFREAEVELLMGEPRLFKLSDGEELVGLQFRGGLYGVIELRDGETQLVKRYGNEKIFSSGDMGRVVSTSKIWEIGMEHDTKIGLDEFQKDLSQMVF